MSNTIRYPQFNKRPQNEWIQYETKIFSWGHSLLGPSFGGKGLTAHHCTRNQQRSQHHRRKQPAVAEKARVGNMQIQQSKAHHDVAWQRSRIWMSPWFHLTRKMRLYYQTKMTRKEKHIPHPSLPSPSGKKPKLNCPQLPVKKIPSISTMRPQAPTKRGGPVKKAQKGRITST